jgi:glycosyltransferase involved in cell wall biosynthesis
MRIAYVYDAVYPEIRGGVEKRIWEIARRLAQRGHDVHIFGMKVWTGETTMIREGVIHHGISRQFHLYRKGKRRIFPALIFGFATFFALARERFDIVDCQQFPYISALSGMVSCRLSGSPFLITWHELWSDYWYEYLGPIGGGGKILEQFLARSPAPAIAVSMTTGEELAGISGRQDYILVPNGVDLAEIDAVLPSPVSSDIVFAGRLIREKHVDVLIEAVFHLRGEIGDIRCLIIGDGPERENLENLVDARKLRNAVTFTGFLPRSEDVIGYMKSSRVFVFPSTREGFGMAVLEALGCGLPVVTIDHPSNAARFLVTEGCGAVCSLDPRDLSMAIQNILKDRGSGGILSRNRAQEFDWEKIVDLIEDYYSRISGRQHTAGSAEDSIQR